MPVGQQLETIGDVLRKLGCTSKSSGKGERGLQSLNPRDRKKFKDLDIGWVTSALDITGNFGRALELLAAAMLTERTPLHAVLRRIELDKRRKHR